MFALDKPVLVVDDMELIRQVVRAELQKIGFATILEAATAEEAWKALSEAMNTGNPVQLVISDWNMPGRSGLDLLKSVRTTPQVANLPFILLTTESEMENVMQAIKAGVSNYIVKPFEPGKLIDKIKLVWDKHNKLA